MEDPLSLDSEYKRYLQILRPYLGQLTDAGVIQVCTAWIQRLSDCTDEEKVARNKYVFSLCYQLAKGVLEAPFTSLPPHNSFLITESISSDDSSEIECAVINPDDGKTETIYDSKLPHLLSLTEISSRENQYSKTDSLPDSEIKCFSKSCNSQKQTVVCYTCPEIVCNYNKCSNNDETYSNKAQYLIKRLRDIKNENCKLHCELLSLKEETLLNKVHSDEESVKIKVDSATSAFMQRKESSATLKSLKFRLQEVQESRNGLIDQISTLQEQLDNYNGLKSHEIEEIIAKHRMEVIQVKSSVKEEVKEEYEKKIESIKINYEAKLKNIEDNSASALQELKVTHENTIEDLNNTIKSKNSEIERLKSQTDEFRSHLHSVLEKYIDKHGDGYSEETARFRVQQLEKRLHTLEKNKIKSTRLFEAKIAQLQKEKHMVECSFQLQLVKQRTQVVNEVTDENQAEITAALDKLEGKYKDIVANVQATAIQRRMQDQKAIESILQAACSIPSENTQANRQFTKTRHSQIYDNEISPLLHCNKGNKSSGEDGFGSGFCLNGERIGELFERVYIPQRDNTDK